MKDDFLSIGAFAARAGLSQKALRLYDRLGLLPPVRVDPATGYRRYRAAQLKQARLILLLREVGMPLSEIGQLLSAAPGAARRRLHEHWQHREAAVVQGRRIVTYLDALLDSVPVAPSHRVQTKILPAQAVLSTCRRVAIDDLSAFIHDAIDALSREAAVRGLAEAGPASAVFHGPVNTSCDGPVEVCLRVDAPRGEVAGAGGVELPARRLAYVKLRQNEARFPEILDAYDATWLWIQQRGLHPAGPPMEIYARLPGCDDACWEGQVEVARPYTTAGSPRQPLAT